MSGVPVCTFCLPRGGTIWAGADPRAAVKESLGSEVENLRVCTDTVLQRRQAVLGSL